MRRLLQTPVLLPTLPFLAVLPFAALPSAVHAADAPAEIPTEVIVQANRFATYRGDGAFSTVDLDHAAVTRSDSLDRSLKLASQAALFRRSSSLTANPTIQGLSLRAIAPSGAGRALVTLDGIPQNDPFGGWVIWAAIPQDALAHAHVVRGAGGGAYGAGALTGVVDLDLLPPRATPAYLRLEAGEGGSRRVAFGGGLGDLSLHYNDQIQHGDAPIRAPVRGAVDIATYGRDRSWLANYQHDLCWGLCGRLDILASGYDSRRDTGLKDATATATGDAWSLSFTQAPTSDHNGLRLQVWHKDSDLANRSVSVAAGRATTTLANDQVATPSTGDGVRLAVRHQTPAVEWEVGVEASRLRGHSEEYYRYISGAPTRFRVTGGSNSLAALYAEASRTLDRLTLTGALRAETWRKYAANRRETDLVLQQNLLEIAQKPDQTATISTRFGADYALSEQTHLRFAAYNGFRPPSLNELYRPFRVGNDVTEANADLRPETLAGLEFGVRNRHLDIGLFYNELSHPVTNVTIGTGPATFPTAGFIPAGGTLRQRQNGNKINVLGLEISAEYPLSDHLSVTSSATLTHARSHGLRPAQAPACSAAIGLAGAWSPVTVSADLIFEGEAYEDDLNTLKLKASRRLDLRAGYAVTPQMALSVAVTNALDDDIQIARSADGTPSFDTGRRVTLVLVYRR